MKRFGRLGWLGAGAVLCNLLVIGTTEGCSGDDNVTDAGDGAVDGKLDVTQDINQQDINQPDVSDGGTGDVGTDAAEIIAFQHAFSSSFCQHLASCCYSIQLDASAPDGSVAACVAFTESPNGGGLENAIGDLSDPLALNSGHIVVDETAKASCLAGLATMTCYTITGTEYETLAKNCLGALHGNIPSGQPGCRRTVECADGFCQWPDGGLAPDASGTCVALSGDGGDCDPRGGGNDQCMYRGWLGTQQLRCDEVETTAGTCGTSGTPTYKCTPKLPDSTGCSFEWECQGACGGENCTCQPVGGPVPFPYTTVCPTYFGPDSGLN